MADSYDSLSSATKSRSASKERQLKELNSRLDEKERDVSRWQKRPNTPSRPGRNPPPRSLKREKRSISFATNAATRLLADAAQWKTTENV